jgi:hypothetical protein
VETLISEDEKNAGRRTGTGSHLFRYGSDESLIDHLSSSSVQPYIPKRSKCYFSSCNLTPDETDENF